MDDVIDDLLRAARRCERAASRFDAEASKPPASQLHGATESVGQSWSGSWLGYQSHVYLRGLISKEPGEHFDSEWGRTSALSNQTCGDWVECSHELILQEILRRANASQQSLDILGHLALEVEGIVEECRADLLPVMDVLLVPYDSPNLREARDKLAKLRTRFSQTDFTHQMMPKGKSFTRDMRAIQGGFVAPPHLAIQAWIMSQRSTATFARELAEIAKYVAKYLQISEKLKGKSVSKKDGPIFIGHGRAKVWTDLKDFLQDRLGLSWEEFNREPTAGLSTKERLLEMLDKCPFAFLVMTAEDEHLDGSKHARVNVIHEIGLFQGRYGWQRAIVLLEEGCEEFSNIIGVGQIRFPKGNIMSTSEEIRRTLEREGLL